ncbi:glycosyltransferase [Rugamonas apoptosis]|nr:glycosyltransferase [Rugamonas apoptosis]
MLMATYNGAPTLPRVLAAYGALAAPDGGWQLVIVDNGSTDHSRDIIAAHARRLPLRYVYEGRRGKNAALNRGLALVLEDAATDLVVLTDDDALPAPNWLRHLANCATAHPAYAVFGGSIVADWASPPPDWVLAHVPLGLTYGLTAPDLADGPVFPGLVWGANMAVRRAVFDAGYRFDESLGPNGGEYAMGGETSFTRRVADAGFRSWFCRDAVVAHHIRAHQLQLPFLLQRARRFGRGQYRQERPGAVPEWLGVPRWMFKRALIEAAGAVLASVRGDAAAAFRHRWELAYLHGYCREAWRGAGRAGPAVLITSHSGALGGMELRMAQEARFLADAGYPSLLATHRFPGSAEWSARLAAEGLRWTPFSPPLFFEQWRWRRWNRWRARLFAVPAMRRHGARLVHVALCWTNYGASALWLARQCRLPVVLSVHGTFAMDTITPWHAPMLRHAFGAVGGVYAVSATAMRHFLAIYQAYLPPTARLAVIPNCVDTDRFQPCAQARLTARAHWGLPPDSLVLGCVARLSVEKRPSLAIALLARLRRRHPQLYLVLVGTGPLESALRNQAEQAGMKQYVIFAGYVQQVETVMPGFDLHLLMSRNEGFGIATIEAMACGVPAVATEVAGSVDILRDSQGGMLVPANDLEQATARIGDLLADLPLREAMGRHGRAEALARYSIAVVGQQVREFYRGLI